MQPISKAWFCQIELTNVCAKECVYCTRYVRHVRKDQQFFMSLETLEKAIQSLEGWPNRIGLIGGEPTLHPDFQAVCELLRTYHPADKYGLWTSGGPRFERFQELIRQTFGFLSLNEHHEEQQACCKHQPLTVAIGDVIEDPVLRKSLINDCWVQKKWCPSISPKGAFFCEIACSLDVVLDGPGGWSIEPGWWDKTPEQFQDQVERYCNRCGMCVPLEREPAVDLAHCSSNEPPKEKFSLPLLEEFRERKLRNITDRDIEVFGRRLSAGEMEEIRPHWRPENYRGDIVHDDGTPVEGAEQFVGETGCWLTTPTEHLVTSNSSQKKP